MPPFDLINPLGLASGAINPVTDTFVIKGAGGVVVAHVKKPDGQVYSLRVQANGALQQFSHFDPDRLTPDERRKLEHDLYTNQNLKQTEIADLIGVSQATVSNDLRRFPSQ